MKSVLVVSTDQAAVDNLRSCLAKEYRLDTANGRAAALEMFQRKRYEFTFVDVAFLKSNDQPNGHTDYKEALQPFWKAFPTAPIIVISPQNQIRESVAAVKAGADNYLTYPFDPEEVSYVTESLLEFQKLNSELQYLRDHSWRTPMEEVAGTRSRLMMEVLAKVKLVAPTRTTVLLTGETGTGKGVIAKMIHNLSNRADQPFIAVHCGAIPDTLLESELFGHEKGSFTGAVRRKHGKFQIADGGTIFLDEIGTVSPSAQIKLLQVLQDKSFNRVGGETTISVDVRVLAATNMDLRKLCQAGDFRTDLYYRLNVFAIELPPLRDRLEDVPPLVESFLERLNRLYSKDIKGVDPEAMQILESYSWPGNIRELENLIERAYILEPGPLLTVEDFPSELMTFENLRSAQAAGSVPTLAEVRQRVLQQMEKRYLREILTLSQGRIGPAADLAGVSTRQLHNLLTRYGLHKEEFR